MKKWILYEIMSLIFSVCKSLNKIFLQLCNGQEVLEAKTKKWQYLPWQPWGPNMNVIMIELAFILVHMMLTFLMLLKLQIISVPNKFKIFMVSS